MLERSLSASRRQKTEHKRLVKQTFIAGLGSVALIIIFLFVILPNASRIFGIFFPSGSNAQSNDTLPPPAPVFFPPTTATSSAMIKIRVQDEVDSEITAFKDLQEVGKTTIGSDGSADLDITLQEGDNIITMQAKDKAGNESLMSKSQTISLDIQAPKIELTSPTDGQAIIGKTQQLLKVEGKTEPGAKVYLNDRFVFAKADGSFMHTLQLNEGPNILNLHAVDNAGNTSDLVLSVNFTP